MTSFSARRVRHYTLLRTGRFKESGVLVPLVDAALWHEVSTVRGSGWVERCRLSIDDFGLAYPQPFKDPPATAGGTDLMSLRHV